MDRWYQQSIFLAWYIGWNLKLERRLYVQCKNPFFYALSVNEYFLNYEKKDRVLRRSYRAWGVEFLIGNARIHSCDNVKASRLKNYRWQTRDG